MNKQEMVADLAGEPFEGRVVAELRRLRSVMGDVPRQVVQG
jgi:hypothetical protein